MCAYSTGVIGWLSCWLSLPLEKLPFCPIPNRAFETRAFSGLTPRCNSADSESAAARVWQWCGKGRQGCGKGMWRLDGFLHSAWSGTRRIFLQSAFVLSKIDPSDTTLDHHYLQIDVLAVASTTAYLGPSVARIMPAHGHDWNMTG